MEGDVAHCITDIWMSKFSTNANMSPIGHWVRREITRYGSETHRHVTALLNMAASVWITLQ